MDQPERPTGNPVVADLSQTNGDTNQFHSLVISHNFIVSPNKINTFGVQFQDFVNAIRAAPGSTFSYPVQGGGTFTNPNICLGSPRAVVRAHQKLKWERT